MIQMNCLLRRAPVALLILLLWLVAPSQNIQAASDGQPKPSAACKIQPPAGWRPYRILPGETLAAFAQQHGVTEEQLRQVNCLKTTAIRPNFLLLAPSNSVASTPTVAATPTVTDMPTVTDKQIGDIPTVTATVVLTLTLPLTPTAALSPTMTPIMKPTLAATPTAPPALSSTPMATIQTATNGQVKPPKAARAAAPIRVAGDMTTGLTGQLWFMAALLLVMIALTSYFSLSKTVSLRVTANQGLISFTVYTLFILGGFLLGLFATSLFQPTSSFSLPTFLSGIGTMLLIGLLILNEMASPWIGQKQTWRRLVTMALVPLLALFVIAVVSRLVAFLR